MPLKQKRKAIRLLFYYLFKESELYLLPETNLSQSIYDTLRENSRSFLKKDLQKNSSLLLILEEKPLINLFRNLKTDLINSKKPKYFLALRGFNFKRSIFFTKSSLESLLSYLK